MIEVNKSRKNVINLEMDDWETELDKEEVYMTRFATHQTSSEESDDSEDESASRTSKKSKSQRSATSKSEDSESEDESENTVPEDKPTIPVVAID